MGDKKERKAKKRKTIRRLDHKRIARRSFKGA